jgi:hypothetical protein
LLDEFPSELLSHSHELHAMLQNYVQKKNQMDPTAVALALELKEPFISISNGSLSSVTQQSFDSLIDLENSFRKNRPTPLVEASFHYTDMPDVNQINLFQN